MSIALKDCKIWRALLNRLPQILCENVAISVSIRPIIWLIFSSENLAIFSISFLLPFPLGEIHCYLKLFRGWIMIYRRRFLCVYLFFFFLFKVQGVEYGQRWWTREWKEFGIFIPTCCPQWKNPFINVAEICCCSSLAWLRDWYDFVGIFHSSSETPCCVKRPQFKHYNCFIEHSCIEHFSPRHQHRHCPIERLTHKRCSTTLALRQSTTVLSTTLIHVPFLISIY